MELIHAVSKENDYWRIEPVCQKPAEDGEAVEISREYRQTVLGFGGCFNEIGWDILQKVDKSERKQFFDELFLEENCGFNTGRVPIGANDFSMEWYSCDDKKEDYELTGFNIERDKSHTIPYIREAMKRCPRLEVFASPWSPPVWMKTKQVYNYGTLKQDQRVLQCYAEYFLKFVRAYREEGIAVTQIHVQNEPMADQKFPSCKWTGEEMRDFIRDHLGPAIQKSDMDTELWVGTINGPFVDFMMPGYSAPFSEFYDQFLNTVLCDEKARSYITGVGLQWGGKHVIAETTLSYPELRYMQTESECGDGQNTWEHAEYIFRLMWFYFHYGVERYMYWNMALPAGGTSAWGWSQNSLVTVDEETFKMTYEPEFYVMKHISKYVKKNAKVRTVKGHLASNTIAFENQDGSIVILLGSNMNASRNVTVRVDDLHFSAEIEPHSIHTFFIKK